MGGGVTEPPGDICDGPSSWPSAAGWAAGPHDAYWLPWFLFILGKTASLTSRPGKDECLLHSDCVVTEVPCTVLGRTETRAFIHRCKGANVNSAPLVPPHPTQGGWDQAPFSDEKTKAWGWAVTCPEFHCDVSEKQGFKSGFV